MACVTGINGTPCRLGRVTRGVVLTGGIGSGKSEVGRALAARGAHVVNADDLAREVVAPGTPGLAAVFAEFGSEVAAPDGSLDRSALAVLVFGRPDRLAVLEEIVHPLVEQLASMRLAAGVGSPLLVYEMPLPLRDGQEPPFPPAVVADRRPFVVVVDAPDDTRRHRLRDRGLPEEQVSARMASQPSREEWLSLADHVIDNSGGLAALSRQVDELWAVLAAPS